MDGSAAPERPAYLDVARSLGGQRWVARAVDERTAMAIAQRFGLPEAAARVIAARGIDIDAVENYLEPTLREALPDPSHLIDMDKAVDRLVRAINDGEEIGVFGDYDVDGATSSALLVRFFQAIGRSLHVYIPDRIKEGYGPNAAALKSMRDAGASVIVTVDCGTTAFDPLSEAADAGIDIIVVDHHVAEPRLPEAVAVINPNRLDETSEHGQLAAVGVTFLLVVALNRALREANWYDKGHAEPNPIAWLDLVALGTVCDVVPLKGVNRALVTQGLKVMGRRANPGIAALADVARMDEAPGAYHAGFLLGPRVNAGGRVGEAGLGVRLLTTADPAEASAIAHRLDGYNTERREIEAQVLEQATAMADAQATDDARILVVAGKGWHPGVIGIVAGRLRERFNLPACVVALDDEGIGKGSGRSVSGVGLGPAVIAAQQAGLLINGGGHAMAAGFTAEEGRLGDLTDFLSDHIDRQLDGQPLIAAYEVDGAVSPGGVTLELLEAIEQAAPFGAGNPRPRFVLPSVSVFNAAIVGTDHVRAFLGSESGGRLKAIAFRSADQPWGQALLNARGLPLHVAGQLRIDTWQGRQTPQIIIEDVAKAG